MIFQKFYFSGIKAGISGSQPVNFFFKKKRNVCVNKWCLDQDFSIRVSIVSSFDKLSKQTKKRGDCRWWVNNAVTFSPRLLQ